MKPFTLLALSLGVAALGLVTLAPGAEAGTTIPGGTFGTSQTWTLAGSPYDVTGDVVFHSGATLTIEAGVVVRQAAGADIQIGTGDPCCSSSSWRARLDVRGTAAAPVVFEQLGDGPSPGLTFRGYNSNDDLGALIQNATFRNVERAILAYGWDAMRVENVTVASPTDVGARLVDSSPTFDGVAFVGGSHGVYGSSWTSRPTVVRSTFDGQSDRAARAGIASGFRDNVFLNMTDPVVELRGGNVGYAASFRIPPAGAPYELFEAATVRSGATLTIEAGVTIRGANDATIQIGTGDPCCSSTTWRGRLEVLGTAAAPVVFESVAGHAWPGFRLVGYNSNDDLGASVRNATFRGVGTGVSAFGWDALTIEDARFESPAQSGVYVHASSPTIRRTTFEGGPYGILASDWRGRPIVDDGAFANQSVRHARVGVASAFRGNAYGGATTSIELLGGNTSYPYSFTVHGEPVPYDLVEGFTMNSGATLRIGEGAHLRGADWAAIQIGTGDPCCSSTTWRARLEVLGSAERPVLFESLAGAHAWPGFRLFGYNSNDDLGALIRNATFRGVGTGVSAFGWDVLAIEDARFENPAQNGVYLHVSSPTLRRAQFVGGSYGIDVSDARSEPRVTDGSFANQTTRHARVGFASAFDGNTYEGTGTSVVLLGAARGASFTIHGEPVDFELRGTGQITHGATLTIEAGARILGAPGSKLVIGSGDPCCSSTTWRGRLLAEGTALEPVTLAAMPGGSWDGLVFQGYNSNDLPSTLRNVTVRGTSGDGIRMNGWDDSTLDRVRVEDAGGRGIALVSSDRNVVQGSVVRGAAMAGVHLDAGSTDNLLFDNVFANAVNAEALASANAWNVAPRAGANVCGGLVVAGNAWSDYGGTDADADGIGDTAYTTGLGGASDAAPLACDGPVAAFSFARDDADATVVAFTDESVPAGASRIVSWHWDFGDGATSTAQHPTHDFALDDTFVVTLTVTDELGHAAHANATLTVDGNPPTTVVVLTGVVGASDWFTSAVGVALEANDAVGVSDIFYRFGGSGDFLTYGGPMNVTSEGAHRLEYYAVDTSGNAELVKNTTFRIDVTAPVTVGSPSGPAGSGGWFVGDVGVALSASDGASGVASTTYRVDGGGALPYEGPLTVTGDGVHEVSFWSADVAGLVEEARALDVPIDTQPPTSSAQLVGTPGTNGWWRSSVEAHVAGADATSGVALVEASVGDAPLAPFAEPIVVAEDGITILQHRATDVAGLVGALAQGEIRIDTELPLASAAVANGTAQDGWYVTPVTVAVGATDAVSGVARIEYRSATLTSGQIRTATGDLTFDADGDHLLQVRGVDVAGNAGAWVDLPLAIDLLPPVIGSTPASGGWHPVASLDVAVTATDAGSGVASLSCSLDGGATATTCGASIRLDGEGTHQILVGAVDVVGRESAADLLFGLDATPPSLEVNLSGVEPSPGFFTSAVTVAAAAFDGLSGLQPVEYALDGGAWTPWSGDLVVSTDGNHTIEVRVADLAGNVASVARSFEIDIDSTPPVTTLTIPAPDGNGGWHKTRPTLRFDAVDGDSPVAATHAAFGPATTILAGSGGLSSSSGWTLPIDGAHEVAYFSVDAVGNAESEQRAALQVDATPPAVAILPSGASYAPGEYSTAVAIAVEAVDATSGVARIEYSLDGAAWTTYTEPVVVDAHGPHTLQARAFDVAGGVSAIQSLSFAIDVTPPVPQAPALDGTAGAAMPDGTPAFNGPVTIGLSALDLDAHGDLVNAEIRYRVCVACDGVAYEVLGEPIVLDGEGAFTVEYFAVDEAGHASDALRLRLVIDVTTPVADARIEVDTDRVVEREGLVYIRGEVCVRLDARDLLGEIDPRAAEVASGLYGLTYVVEDAAGRVVRLVNGTLEELYDLAEIPIDLSLALCEDLPDGHYTWRGRVCDRAEWPCIRPSSNGTHPEWQLGFHVDQQAPRVEIVWPPAGSLSLDGTTLPLAPDANACGRALRGDPTLDPAIAAACAAMGPLDALLRDHAPEQRDALRNVTVLAGQVPVVVRAADTGSGLDAVWLDVDGVRLEPIRANGTASGDFVFVVDTRAHLAADEIVRGARLDAGASDLLQTIGGAHPRDVLLVNADPPLERLANLE